MSPLVLFLVAVVPVLAGLVSIAGNMITDHPPEWLGPVAPFALPVFLVGSLLSVLSGLIIYARDNSVAQVAPEAPGERERVRLIELVRSQVDDMLRPPSDEPKPLQLRLEARPELVKPHSRRFARRLAGTSEPTAIDAFDAVRSLLLVGEPGAGKSRELAALARTLLQRAEQELSEPVPVLVNLSSWTAPQDLSEWLVNALRNTYGMSAAFASAWVNPDRVRVLLLLDGLDQAADPAGAVTALNAFRDDHAETPMGVCCRLDTYSNLRERLRLEGAVRLKPLTDRQIRDYLMRAGVRPETVRAALGDEGWKLLDAPLMLGVVTRTFRAQPSALGPATETLLERRSYLLGAYVDAMLEHRRDQDARVRPTAQGGASKGASTYPRSATLDWLSWLAFSMRRYRQSRFRLDMLGPGWLTRPGELLKVSLSSTTQATLLLTMLFAVVFAFAGRMVLGGADGEQHGAILGSLTGGLAGMIFANQGDNRPFDSLSWSWSDIPEILGKIAAAALLIGWIFAQFLDVDLATGIVLGTLMAILLGVIRLLSAGLVKHLSPTSQVPNEKIQRAARYAITYWLISALILALLFALVDLAWKALLGAGYAESLLAALGLGEPAGPVGRLGDGFVGSLGLGLLVGLSFGLLMGLKFGGLTCIEYLVLRQNLTLGRRTPLRYARFLDYAVDRVLLRRVGGAYEFIHPLLLDYFADRVKLPPATPDPATGSQPPSPEPS